MQNEINTLLTEIKNEYYDYMTRRGKLTELSEHQQKMVEEFNNGLEVTEGKKYIKVLSNRSVWGFIMKDSDKKFRKGDILKAAGWNAPARNAARGNIIDGGYSICWTGPHYLK